MMENDLDILFKSNTIVKAGYDFTLIQNKVVQSVLYKAQTSVIGLTKFTLKEMKSLIGSKQDSSIESIKEMLESLVKQKPISIENENGSYIQTYIFVSHEYNSNEQVFTIGVAPMFVQLLKRYAEKGFTPINITRFIELKGTSSQRFYELLRMWTGTKHIIEYKVKDIRKYLLLEDKYSDFANFRRRIVESAVKDINKQGLMNIHKVEYVKKGKSIDSIKFYVKDLEPRTYNFKPIENKVDNKIVNDENNLVAAQIEIDDFLVEHNDSIENKLAIKSKLSVSTIKKLIDEYSEQEVKYAIDILVDTPRVTARLKYLKGILKNKKESNLNNSKCNKNKISKFNNYNQRKYDYEKLENDLLGWV